MPSGITRNYKILKTAKGMLRAIIFTEGSATWGMGHLYRCAAYAEELASRGWAVEWRICGDGHAREFFTASSVQYETWWANPALKKDLAGAHIALVDSYQAQLGTYETISKAGPYCLYLDDEARLAYPRGYVANSVPQAEELAYALGPATKLLAGPSYYPLRSAFQRPADTSVRPEIRNILVMLGGTDIRELTGIVIKQVRSIFPAARIQAIVPSTAQREQYRDRDNVDLLPSQSATELCSRMQAADLCISAAGQTLYELCYMGVPTIAIGVAENQRWNIKGFSSAGAVLFAGWWNDVFFTSRLNSQLCTIQEYALRKVMKQIGQSLVDGKGVKRVLDLVIGSRR